MGGHTKGNCKWTSDNNGWAVLESNQGDIIRFPENAAEIGCILPSDDEGHFIAEAFNVAAETGRTPAQLAAERTELVAELTNLLEVVTNKTCHGNGAAAKKARAILAKVKGGVS